MSDETMDAVEDWLDSNTWWIHLIIELTPGINMLWYWFISYLITVRAPNVWLGTKLDACMSMWRVNTELLSFGDILLPGLCIGYWF